MGGYGKTTMIGRTIRRWGQACGMLAAILVLVLYMSCREPAEANLHTSRDRRRCQRRPEWELRWDKAGVFRIVPIAAVSARVQRMGSGGGP